MNARTTIQIAACVLFTTFTYAQVGINNVDPKATLDITASNKATPANTDGILIPRVDRFPAAAPGADQESMLVYLTAPFGTDGPGFYYWSNAVTKWLPLDKEAWGTKGNLGTNATTHYLGTNDLQDLIIRTNSAQRIKVGSTRGVVVGPALSPIFPKDVFTGYGQTNGDHAVNGYSPDATGVGVFGSQIHGLATFRPAGGSFVGASLGSYGRGQSATGTGVRGDGGSLVTAFNGNGAGGVFNGTNIGVLANAAVSSATIPARLGADIHARSASGSPLRTRIAGTFTSGLDYGIYAQSNSFGVLGVGTNWGVLAIGDSGATRDVIATRDVFANGNVTANVNIASNGTKTFIIDHPLDPANKKLRHFSIESDEVLNLYRGKAEFDANGEAVVSLPNYFHAINIDFTYQLTPIGASMQLYIKEEISEGKFVIAGGVHNKKVSWQVMGERNDKFLALNPELKEIEPAKKGDEVGKYYHPEAFGKSAKQSIHRKAVFNEVTPKDTHTESTGVNAGLQTKYISKPRENNDRGE